MSRADFAACTPSEFRAIYDRWAEQATAAERQQWERTRMLAVAVLQPYSKGGIDPRAAFPFPWDAPAVTAENEDITPQRIQAALERYKLK